MKRIHLLPVTILIHLLGFFTPGTVYTQIYINNENSISTAILEIASTEKGFLIPHLISAVFEKIVLKLPEKLV